MKKSHVSVAAGLLLLMILGTSCNRQKQETDYIPKDAGVVLGFNLKALLSKVDFNKIKQSPGYQEMLGNAPDSTTRSLMEDPSNLGIDLGQDIYFFYQQDKRFGTGYLGVVAGLADANKLESYLKAHQPSVAVKMDGGLGHILLNGKVMIGWTDHIVMVLAKPMGNQVSDTGTTMTFLDLFKELDKQGESGSVAGNSNFSPVEQSGGDLMFWLNMGQLYQGMSNMPMNSMLSGAIKPEMYVGNYFKGDVNFGQDKITADMKFYLNDQMTEILKKMTGHSIDQDLIRRIPSDSPLAVVAMSFNPEGIKNYLNELGFEGVIDEALSQKTNIGLDTVLKAFKGDLVLALTHSGSPAGQEGQAVPGTGGNRSMQLHSWGWLGMITVGDTASMDKVLDAVSSFGILTRQGPMSYQINPNYSDSSFNFVSNPKMLVLASSKGMADQYISGGGPVMPGTLLDQFNNKNFGIYLNIKGIVSAFRAMKPDSTERPGMSASSMFKDMYWTGTGIDGHVESQNFTVDLVDGHENSLMQLFDAAIKMGNTYKMGGSGNTDADTSIAPTH